MMDILDVLMDLIPLATIMEHVPMDCVNVTVDGEEMLTVESFLVILKSHSMPHNVLDPINFHVNRVGVEIFVKFQCVLEFLPINHWYVMGMVSVSL